MTPPNEQHGAHDEHAGHAEHSPFVQHHYDDAQHQFDAGKLGIWFFLVQEILFFSGLFVAYILYRHHHPEVYLYAHHYLDVKWGAINTAVLIISSLTAAWAVRCAQLNQQKGLIACIAITIVCACGFLGIKYVEYTHKIHEHILFGKRFDPCVASGGAHLLNKGNKCPGTKSSVQWDFGAGAAKAGCFEGDYDQDKAEKGLQGECKVEEVKWKWDKIKVDVWWDAKKKQELGEIGKTPDIDKLSDQERDDPKKKIKIVKKTVTHKIKVETGRRPIEEECKEGGKEKEGVGCWELAQNPYICPAGPGVLVKYGDEKVRGELLTIEATCEKAPPPPPEPKDPLADVSHPTAMGQVTVKAPHKLTKHEQMEEFANGPPPPHTNMFFSIYFAMTGLHGLHVLVGVFIFIWLLIRAIKGQFTPDYFGPIDYAALYWHLVDLIWIFLFPLLYLIH